MLVYVGMRVALLHIKAEEDCSWRSALLSKAHQLGMLRSWVLKFLRCYVRNASHSSSIAIKGKGLYDARTYSGDTQALMACTLLSSGLSQDRLISPFSCYVCDMQADWPRCGSVCPFTVN